MLCLDSITELKYCPNTAREKRGSCKHLWCQGAQACKRYLGSGLVISSVCLPFIPIERSEDDGAVSLVGDQQCWLLA